MDQSHGATQKRARPSEERDPRLYIDDGNLVVSATDLQTGVLHYFRIHRSTLSRYSPVLKEMLSMPVPSSVESYDGVSLVHVPDDAQDVRSFFMAIYES